MRFMCLFSYNVFIFVISYVISLLNTAVGKYVPS
jgi:hypothetical protein